MQSRSETREHVAHRLHRAAEIVQAVGVQVEFGHDCVMVLRTLADAHAQLDEARRLLAIHEAQTCIDILAGSECIDDLRHASDRFTRMCTRRNRPRRV